VPDRRQDPGEVSLIRPLHLRRGPFRQRDGPLALRKRRDVACHGGRGRDGGSRDGEALTTPSSDRPLPIAAAIAVVARGGRLLLVRRSNRPDAGRWGFPGGKIEPGEATMAAALRELAEETGVRAEPAEVLTAVDVIRRDPSGALHHYVLIAVLCRWLDGDGAAADDAEEVGWFTLEELRDLPKSPDVGRVAALALARSAG
jgi:8-oxo-dGTP diphosphatase